MSAMDGVNRGIGVWNNAVEGMATSMRQMAEERERVQEMNYANQLTGWQNYAGRLEKYIAGMKEKLDELSANHKSLIEDYKKTKTEDNVYIQELIKRIQQVDEDLNRFSGKSHLNARMRDFLLTNLVDALGKEKTQFIYDKMVAKETLDSYWEEYKNAPDPRYGVPIQFDMTKSILSNGKMIKNRPA